MKICCDLRTLDFGQEVHNYIVYILYILHIVLIQIRKFAITRKNGAFVAKIANTRLMKFAMAIFAHAERLSTSAPLDH